MKKIELLKDHSFNGTSYKKGDTLQVSEIVAEAWIHHGWAKTVPEPVVES